MPLLMVQSSIDRNRGPMHWNHDPRGYHQTPWRINVQDRVRRVWNAFPYKRFEPYLSHDYDTVKWDADKRLKRHEIQPD